MIWFKYIAQDYMDMRPGVAYRLFEDKSQALAWEKHMQENYSGGTTTIVGPATQKEILAYIKFNDIILDQDALDKVNNPNYYQIK